MQLTKILNDFAELETDLNTLMKAEKDIEYRRFLEYAKINIGTWRAKVSYFFDNATEYAKELEKENKKGSKRDN